MESMYDRDEPKSRMSGKPDPNESKTGKSNISGSASNDASGAGDDDEEEEKLIKPAELIKCKQVFDKVSKQSDFIKVEEALVILKAISDIE